MQRQSPSWPISPEHNNHQQCRAARQDNLHHRDDMLQSICSNHSTINPIGMHGSGPLRRWQRQWLRQVVTYSTALAYLPLVTTQFCDSPHRHDGDGAQRIEDGVKGCLLWDIRVQCCSCVPMPSGAEIANSSGARIAHGSCRLAHKVNNVNSASCSFLQSADNYPGSAPATLIAAQQCSVIIRSGRKAVKDICFLSTVQSQKSFAWLLHATRT